MGFKQFWQWMTTDPSKKKLDEKGNVIPHKKHKLGKFVVLFILINSILGSSLFYLPSLGVISSGAASIIAWVALFIIATLIMMYMAELITLHPTSGGTYEFCKRAYGRFGSFMGGWLIWVAGNMGMALNIVAAAEYFIPNNIANKMVLRLIFAGVWIIALNFMAFRGIDAGAIMLVIFGVIASIVVVLMTLPSFLDFGCLFSGSFAVPFKLTYLDPFFRHSGISILGYLGLSLLLISEAFFGFEAISYMADEVENTKKLPNIMIGAILVSGAVMLLYLLSSLGTVSYHDYVTDARPFAVQALNTMGEFGQQIVVFGMYLVIIGAAAAWPITGSRLIQAMSKDKLFVEQLAVSHPVHKSPHRAIFFQTGIVTIICLLIFLLNWSDSYRSIYMIYVIIGLVMLALVLFTVPILRRKEKHLERVYKAPFGTLGPIAIGVGIVALIANWIFIEGGVATSLLEIAGSFILFGLPFYFLVEMLYNPESIRGVNDKLAYLVLLTDKLFFPISIRNTLLKDMGDLKGKKILEYGSSVGTLTRKLGERVGDKGQIYAVDFSLTKAKIVEKRTKHLKHVKSIHHPHLHDVILDIPQKVDGIISVGMLSHMQKPAVMLEKLSHHINKGGEIVFLDFDKFFYIIPNVKWLESNEKLHDMFSKAGFEVEVTRKRGLLWQYIVVVGVKK